MLKYFRVAEICFLIEANGQKAVVQSLLQSAADVFPNALFFCFTLFLWGTLHNLVAADLKGSSFRLWRTTLVIRSKIS